MSEIDQHTPWKPGMRIYGLATLVGAVLAVVLAGVVFATSTIVIAASMGAIFAIFGGVMDENIGEAVVLTVILGAICGVLLWVAPEPVAKWSGTWAVPAVIGFCASKIIVGISRELG